MRYQERIYIQNENRGVRNKDILNVNMSSDFGVFKSPTFDISGATKVPCGTITCNLTGYSLNNMLTAATSTCLTATTTLVKTLLSVDWSTKIYEDNVLSYSGSFYSTTISGDVPTDTYFLSSIANGLTTLGYNYLQEDTTFLIDKIYGGAKSLEFDVCISFNVNQYSCPVGFSATPANDICKKIDQYSAPFLGNGPVIVSGNTFSGYSTSVRFYPNVENNGALPVLYPYGAGSTLKDQTGGTINAIASSTTNTYWVTDGTPLTTLGKLNVAGISGDTSQWLGFSECLNITEAGTYYVGLASDDYCRFSVNGKLIVALTGNSGNPVGCYAPNPVTHEIWSVFPIYLNSGINLIEVEGLNWPQFSTCYPFSTNYSAFAAEIYKPTSFAQLTAATNDTQAGLIFSTKNKVGSYYDISSPYTGGSTTIGYTCPSGYALNKCDVTPICSKITTSAITATTAHCLDNCVITCNDSFPYIENSSTGVYVVDTTTTTTIPFTFNFTGNTYVFSATNASFKYEIYKYTNNLGLFSVPPVYKSDLISYSAFSGTNILQQSIPLSGLQLDGQYVIKGFYEADSPVEFMSKLGKKIDTSAYAQFGEFQLYDKYLDYYFLAISQADKPVFTPTIANNTQSYDGLALYQQVIIADNTTPKTGSTFTLTTPTYGDVFVTLNGLNLAKDYDYTLTGTVLTFYGPIVYNDIITIVYTRTAKNILTSDVILLDSTIPSGTTNSQGSNQYYYNTTTGKYEIYTSSDILTASRFIVILNGQTLTYGVDFYLSTTSQKRIILEGVLMVGDIINIIYYPTATIIDGISQTNNSIDWSIANLPETNNGEFTLQYSTNNSFVTYYENSPVPYVSQIGNYNSILSLTGAVGTNWYYRVKNVKNYQSICGDIINSTAYSDTVKVKIISNAINSY